MEKPKRRNRFARDKIAKNALEEKNEQTGRLTDSHRIPRKTNPGTDEIHTCPLLFTFTFRPNTTNPHVVAQGPSF